MERPEVNRYACTIENKVDEGACASKLKVQRDLLDKQYISILRPIAPLAVMLTDGRGYPHGPQQAF